MGTVEERDVIGIGVADYEDNIARVAGEAMERIANSDIQKDSDTYAMAMNHALEDRLLPGMGSVRPENPTTRPCTSMTANMSRLRKRSKWPPPCCRGAMTPACSAMFGEMPTVTRCLVR